MIKWKDRTEYSTSEIKESQLNLSDFKLSVHRHIHYAPDVWLASCFGLFERAELKSKNIDEARTQAKAILQVKLEEALKEITDV